MGQLKVEGTVQMASSLRTFIRPASLFVAAIIVMTVSVVNGQTTSTSTSTSPTQVAPVFKDYRGVHIGMAADEVRGKLERIKKGDRQDYLAFSDQESAQIYYDAQGKVTAISIDYFGGSNAPTPEAVLGSGIQPKQDGSMYQLTRYPKAGYWVSYNRTAGDKPIVTITIQKL
jgi:hypothetical protein